MRLVYEGKQAYKRRDFFPFPFLWICEDAMSRLFLTLKGSYVLLGFLAVILAVVMVAPHWCLWATETTGKIVLAHGAALVAGLGMAIGRYGWALSGFSPNNMEEKGETPIFRNAGGGLGILGSVYAALTFSRLSEANPMLLLCAAGAAAMSVAAYWVYKRALINLDAGRYHAEYTQLLTTSITKRIDALNTTDEVKNRWRLRQAAITDNNARLALLDELRKATDVYNV